MQKNKNKNIKVLTDIESFYEIRINKTCTNLQIGQCVKIVQSNASNIKAMLSNKLFLLAIKK